MDILDFIIKLPEKIYPTLEEIIVFFNTPILELLSEILVTDNPFLAIIIRFFSEIFNNNIAGFNENTTIFGLLLGVGLPLILVLALVKWIIGIIM